MGVDSMLTELFQSRAIMPSQYFDKLKPRYMVGAKRLALAILEDVVDCLTKEHGKHYNDAVQWVMSDDEGWVFSFINVCHYLDLEPSLWRKALLNLERKRYCVNPASIR